MQMNVKEHTVCQDIHYDTDKCKDNMQFSVVFTLMSWITSNLTVKHSAGCFPAYYDSFPCKLIINDVL